MKPPAVFFTVILMLTGTSLVGCSFNTKDKIRTTTHDSKLILPEIPLEDEKAAPAPIPDIKIASLRNTTKPELIEVKIKQSTCEGLKEDCAVIPPPTEESDSIKDNEIDGLLMCNLESEAEYPGGAAAWQRYLNRNMHFSIDSIDSEVNGNIMVKFVVDEKGNVCEVEAVRGSKVLCEEAVRVIKQSGKWIPAKRLSTGRCVRSFKMQPFIICFAEEE